MSALGEGRARSAFCAVFRLDRLPLVEQMSYRIPGMAKDSILKSGQIPQSPSLIKIDVDGIEHPILQGAHHVLRSPTPRSALVELNDQFRELESEDTWQLIDAGFELWSKGHSELFESGR